MLVPNLKPVSRNREYLSYTDEQRDSIVYNYLFIKGVSHRNLDEKVLGLNPDESKGWQAMGVLHHLGLKKQHKGVFNSYSIDEVIKILNNQDALHFKLIIDSLSRFKIANKISRVFDSWELLGNNLALKTVDKSTFAHNGTGVPMGIRGFFEIENLYKNDRKSINLIYNDISYVANIEMDTLENPRSRLFWKADFRDLLREVMPTYYELLVNNNVIEDIKLPKIRFLNVDESNFEVGFIYPNEIIKDINEEIDEEDNSEELSNNIESKGRKEGNIKFVYGRQYERDPKNRVDAIKYHGTKCIICEFDFEKVYGVRGKGYIEIHHLKPLSTVGKETDVNPKTDLVPVCSNCHKMIHRKRDRVLSIEEMKKIIISN